MTIAALYPTSTAKRRRSFVDRYLTLWIVLTMLLGIGLGAAHLRLSEIVVPIGLIVMMYPPFARVRYEALPAALGDARLLTLSLVQNWVIAPLLMFALAAAFLHGRPDLFAGLVMVGLARCIAMVVAWSELAHADREYTAALVAVNSVFQVFGYAAYAYVFVTVLPPLVGMPSVAVPLSISSVAVSVLIYLGIPAVAGAMTLGVLRPRLGVSRYDDGFVPAISPLTLVALLVTIAAMFALQGARIIAQPLDVVLVAAPLIVYFGIMFFVSFSMGVGRVRRTDARRRSRLPRRATISNSLSPSASRSSASTRARRSRPSLVRSLKYVLPILVNVALRRERTFAPHP